MLSHPLFKMSVKANGRIYRPYVEIYFSVVQQCHFPLRNKKNKKVFFIQSHLFVICYRIIYENTNSPTGCGVKRLNWHLQRPYGLFTEAKTIYASLITPAWKMQRINDQFNQPSPCSKSGKLSKLELKRERKSRRKVNVVDVERNSGR